MELLVVIPAYNEADNLAALYRELKGVLRSFEGTSEVLVVDDGSTDGVTYHRSGHEGV